MANTVTSLSYANTFGDWVVTTNALTRENNDLASNNYVKPTGTLFLNAPTLGLQVANNAIVAGQLQVQGIGSSAYIQNNLRVDTQVYFQNTILGLTNSGELISNGKISAAGSGLGLAVANNTTIGGTLSVGRNTTVGGFLNVAGNTSIANSLSVTGPTTVSNTMLVTGDSTYTSNIYAQKYIITTFDVTANRLIAYDSATTPALTVINNASVGGQLSVGGNFVINGTTVYNANVFTLNADSIIGLNSAIRVNRGTSGSNAVIRWNEANSYWDMIDVNNNNYYRVLTNEYFSDSTNLPSSINVATSAAVASLQGVDNTQNTRIQSIETINNNQNTSISIIQGVDATQNVQIAGIQGVDIAQNNSITIIQGVDATQNVQIAGIQGVDNTQNTRIQSIETINSNQNTTITQVNQYAAGAYAYANTLPTPSGTNAIGTWAIGISGLAAKASTLSQNGGNGTGMTFNWSGQAGQPSWLWGGNDGSTMFVYNPSNFSVSYATTAGTANAVAWTNVSGRPTNVSSFTNDSNYITNGASTRTLYSLYTNIIYDSDNAGYYLDLNGTSRTGRINSDYLYSYDNVVAYSDARVKTNVKTVENALEKTCQLRGVNYTRTDLENKDKVYLGVIAQEVQKVIPEVVDIDQDGNLAVAYGNIVGLLIESIKELKAEIDLLKKS